MKILIILFKNDDCHRFDLTGAIAKVLCVVIFLQFVIRSTAQTLRKKKGYLHHSDVDNDTKNYQRVLNIYLS